MRAHLRALAAVVLMQPTVQAEIKRLRIQHGSQPSQGVPPGRSVAPMVTGRGGRRSSVVSVAVAVARRMLLLVVLVAMVRLVQAVVVAVRAPLAVPAVTVGQVS